MPDVFLIGGGWNAAAVRSTYGRFVAAAGGDATVACVVLDALGHEQYCARLADVLHSAGARRVLPVFVGARALEPVDVDGADAVFVGGGLTPAYVEAVAVARAWLPEWLATNDVPYAGFSAGAAIAASTAVLGGWKMSPAGREITVCPEEVAGDVYDVVVRDGLGLVPFAVDVHASAWGTLSRMVSVVEAGLSSEGWAVDEDTLLHVAGDDVQVHGLGRAYHVRRAASRGAARLGTTPASAVDIAVLPPSAAA